MSGEKSSYRQIMKATSIFGGVQIFGIVIAIVRSKFIAILLGPTGMGISGLLTSTTGLIGGITNFGLSNSAIKNITSIDAGENPQKIAEIKYIISKWFTITGLLGLFITAMLSPLLSKLTFGTYDYTISFLALSITLLIAQLNNKSLVILQGLRKIKLLATANLIGSIMGLISIPLYYWFGLQGIVPALIFSSIISMLISYYFEKKTNIINKKVSYTELISVGKVMLKLGFVISISNIITIAFSYIIRIYIGKIGGVEHVGLFNAGFAIVNSYVGLVFTAMSTDYFPRLSAVSNNVTETNKTINQQAEIAMLILSPIIIVFVIFINYIIILLYSNKFIEINGMIKWFAIGMLFKAFSWAIAYIFLAKGDSKMFFISELLSNIYILGFNIIGYSLYGLTGLGISFTFGYFVYLIQVYYLSKKNYGYSTNKATMKIFIIQSLLSLFCFFMSIILSGKWMYSVCFGTLLLSITYSIKELNTKIDLLKIITSKFRNDKKN